MATLCVQWGRDEGSDTTFSHDAIECPWARDVRLGTVEPRGAYLVHEMKKTMEQERLDETQLVVRRTRTVGQRIRTSARESTRPSIDIKVSDPRCVAHETEAKIRTTVLLAHMPCCVMSCHS